MTLSPRRVINRWWEVIHIRNGDFDDVTAFNAQLLTAEMTRYIPSTEAMVSICKAQLSASWERSPTSRETFHRRIGASGDVDPNQTCTLGSIQKKFDKKMTTMLDGRRNFLSCRFGHNFIRFILLECNPELLDIKKRFRAAAEIRLEAFGFPTRVPGEVDDEGRVLSLRHDFYGMDLEDFEDVEYDYGSDTTVDSDSE